MLPPTVAKTQGMAGLNRVWDGTSGEWAYVESLSICRAFWNIPGNKNRFKSLSSPDVSMPHITAVQCSNNFNIILLLFLLSSA